MKPLLIFLNTLLFASIVSLSSCKESGKKPEIPPFNAPVDSTASQPTSPGKDSTTSPGVALPPGDDDSFTAHMTRYTSVIFGSEFTTEKIDEIERMPRLHSAKEMDFKKFIRNGPVQTKYGKVIPRLILKGYRFNSFEALKKDFESWINGGESSDKDIQLGEDVEALKSPPFVCAVMENELYMMQTACVYSGAELEAVIARFMELFGKEGAKFRFRVACGVGKVEYIK